MPPQHQDHSTSSAIIIKGKRTKRPRSNSPSNPPPDYYNSNTSSSLLSTSSDNTGDDNQEEEEDMANCLIMLAQGNGSNPCSASNNDHQLLTAIPNNAAATRGGANSRKFSQITNRAGFFLYDCKTCNRSFPSFQALGGHRASHKKHKTIVEDRTNVIVKPVVRDGEETEIASAPTTLALQISTSTAVNNKAKVHECSICGAEFSSGQALGGHMRRHRAAMMANIQPAETAVDIKQRNVLSLDLNLPAPEDDHHLHTSPKFQYGASPALVFSTPALVDCHY